MGAVGAVRAELSQSRTYDAALEVSGAYKLTNNFPLDLQIVLKNLGALGKISFEIKPKTLLSDCRHVEFQPNNNTDAAEFRAIMQAINSRIGFDPTPAWWAKAFRSPFRKPFRLSAPRHDGAGWVSAAVK